MDSQYLDEGFHLENMQENSRKSAPKRKNPATSQPASQSTPFKLSLNDMRPVPPEFELNTPTTSQRAKVRIVMTTPNTASADPVIEYDNTTTEQESILDPIETEMSPGTSTPKPGQPANQNSSASQPTNSDLQKIIRGTYRLVMDKSKKQEERLERIEKLLIPPKKQKSPEPRLLWPVPDRSQLDLIEAKLADNDNFVKDSLMEIWERADKCDLYKFVSTNLRNLLRKAGRWTWTGKPSNAKPDAPKSECAQALKSVGLLKDLAISIFNTSEKDVVSVCMRTLSNTNDINRKNALKKGAINAQVAGPSDH
ncbi:uncharacterized protein LOC120416061 isoform X3 [Culex pipiens pallens]|uniref:uncharacterized protein LOC120416061 isoform X3 n=1 Tax=Culex pipiens pallens TaxID=42434 RepID=UPI0022AACB2D|nr:uncharacterized protein LOC120416061 isoform X3 [Culex pipiens pallens]XP_052566747.1 uncharacterized protein LOC120416061 isoform X3 [Culex pipiens pallens]XP_052566748.1 uncharacterized protein LOC120416061 isoform X3 [Culex pipiens pallens]XP_052566749.1 uncharacterized protein LOC120416061 isoform X3 [Culex pipiens pallens]XP_052566750.1 uncharacterized protein LOC120416061 isoform X3 [Culex pipiens pallens]